MTSVLTYGYTIHPKAIATVKQVFFHYQVGSSVDHRAYKPYTPVGPPALQLILDPLAVNSSTTDYV